jgi:ketosteroid isomerase-like protein
MSVVAQVTPLFGNWPHRSSRSPRVQQLPVGQERVRVSGTNEERAELLSRAIVATISGDTVHLHDVFTLDVLASGPSLRTFSRDQLAREIERRVSAFSERKVAVAPLDVAGDQACVEWVASGIHSGRYESEGTGGSILEPTGRRVRLRAISVAEFEGDQICSLRSYWDDASLVENLSATGPD